MNTLTYDVDGRIARITLNRPERGNGITLEMRRELAECVEQANLDPRFGTQDVTIDSVVLRGPDGTPTEEIATGRRLTLSLRLSSHLESLSDPIVGIAIHRAADGVVCYDSSTHSDGVSLGAITGAVTVELEFERLDLLPGEYLFDVGVYRSDWAVAYDFHWQAYPLRVVGGRGEKGVFRPPHRWEVIRQEAATPGR